MVGCACVYWRGCGGYDVAGLELRFEEHSLDTLVELTCVGLSKE
jgi:hypothetical protein